MRLLPPIVANLALAAAALGYGSLLAPLFPRNFSRLDRLALTLLGGLGLLGTVLFCVGQVWFSRPAAILIFLPGVILGARSLAREARQPGAHFSGLSLPILPMAVVGVVLLMTAVGGLAEPTGDLNNDAIAYHFLGPKVWLREGVIRPVPDESLTAFPAIVEAEYGALMSLGGQRAPELYAVVAWSSMLFLAAAFAMRLGLDARGAWWVAALVITMPAAYTGGHSGFIDVVFAGFVLAAARIGFDAEELSHYALFGMCCGFAMGTKYTGLMACGLLVCCTVLVATRVFHRNPLRVTTLAGISLAIAGAVACAAYIRNWILLGCPIYPPPAALLRFFTVKYLPPSAIGRLQELILRHGVGMGMGVRSLLRLPFDLTYHTSNFNGAGGIGLAPLALGPFGAIACRRDGFARALALFALLDTAAWFVTDRESRYLIQVYVIAAVFAVAGWKYVARAATKHGSLLCVVVVGCSIGYGLFMIGRSRIDDLHAAVSPSFEARRKQAEIPFLQSFDFLNGEPSATKILILDRDVPTYFSDNEYLKPFGRWGEETLPGAGDLSQLLSRIPCLRVSHVLDVRWNGRAFRLPAPIRGLSLVFEAADQRVYRVDSQCLPE